MIKFSNLLTFLMLFLFNNTYSSDFEDALDTIEVRKTAMQNLWLRIERLSPYVELKEKVDYNKELATNDAEEIIKLLEKTRNLWSDEEK